MATITNNRILIMEDSAALVKVLRQILEKNGYRAKEVWPVDMFPWSGAVEAVCSFVLKKDR